MITKSPEIIASQIVKMLRKAGLTPEQMLQVIELAKYKIENWHKRQQVINFKN
jgi:hypothetical protein